MEKQLEASEIQYGKCKYCNQVYDLETSGLAKEEQLDEWATEKCDCESATDYIRRKKSRIKANEKVIELFGNRKGTEATEVTDIMLQAIKAIAEDHMEDITINIGRGCKGKISINTKGNIKVERTDTQKITWEQ